MYKYKKELLGENCIFFDKVAIEGEITGITEKHSLFKCFEEHKVTIDIHFKRHDGSQDNCARLAKEVFLTRQDFADDRSVDTILKEISNK